MTFTAAVSVQTQILVPVCIHLAAQMEATNSMRSGSVHVAAVPVTMHLSVNIALHVMQLHELDFETYNWTLPTVHGIPPVPR